MIPYNNQTKLTLPIFEIEIVKKTADHIRDIASEFSRRSWALDETLRNLRLADPEDVFLYSELISKVLIAQKEADIFMTKRLMPELVTVD